MKVKTVVKVFGHTEKGRDETIASLLEKGYELKGFSHSSHLFAFLFMKVVKDE